MTGRTNGRENEMNGTKTMGLRLPVQAVVDRTTTGVTLADGVGVEASQNLVIGPVPIGAFGGTRPPGVIQGPCFPTLGGRWIC
jgi:hypothetical protein